jgi:DNA-binding transcriptional MerR regulator
VPEYRVDELARAAGATVRSIRVYQDRGLLPAPQLRGRVGYYDDSHLARLRMIGRLQERGHTLATIGELLAAWEGGRDLSDVLGIEDALTRPWASDSSPVQPVEITPAELTATYGHPEARARAVELRILTPEEENFTVPSQAAIDTGAALMRAGLSMDDVLALTVEVIERTDELARRVVSFVGDRLLSVEDEGALPDSARMHEIRALLEELQPISIAAVAGWFTRSMTEAAAAYLAEVLDGTRRGA